MIRPTKLFLRLKAIPPRGMIRQFTPNWFAATMGTGILALLLPQLPGAGPGLYALGEGLWLANIGLFAFFAILYCARWALFPHEAKRIFSHPVVSMFLGTIPMGLATIINGFLAFGLPRWGSGAIAAAHSLWWCDAAMSLGCGVLIPYCMFTRHSHALNEMTGVWLLPLVAAEVAAASGGLLVPHLTAGARFPVLVASYALWAYSVPIACCILTILFLRLALHKLPHESMAAACWLALGPLGTGSLAMLLLGTDAPAAFAAQGLATVGVLMPGIGIVAGIALWGFGLWWLLLAALITAHYFRRSEMPFNLGWWAYTFPLGVFTAATLKLGAMLNMRFFSVIGTVEVAALAVIWAYVATRTLHGGLKGHLFVSPCIADGRKKRIA